MRPALGELDLFASFFVSGENQQPLATCNRLLRVVIEGSQDSIDHVWNVTEELDDTSEQVPRWNVFKANKI
jgi:hypothetical protein